LVAAVFHVTKINREWEMELSRGHTIKKTIFLQHELDLRTQKYFHKLDMLSKAMTDVKMFSE